MATVTAQNSTAVSEKKDEKPEKRRALGRGLESLLPGPRVVSAGAAIPAAPRSGVSATESVEVAPERLTTAVTSISSAETAEIPQPQVQSPSDQLESIAISAQAEPRDAVLNLAIELIDKNPYQTRYLFDAQEMIELRDSIQEHGVVQPVVVRPGDKDGRFILVLGERRLRASRMAGKETIPALVRRLSPQQAAEMTVLENVVREDLNPIEQAEAYRVLSQQFNLTQAQIAQRIGVSRESVANHMRLLRLPEEVREYVAQGQVSFSQAREILSLDDPDQMKMIAHELVHGRLNWEALRYRIAQLNGDVPIPTPAQPKEKWVDPNVRAAQTEMEQLLGVRVKITDWDGKGTILIRYGTVEDYERIVDIVRKGSNS
jgi:ParB family transcriptional regulator, chromosome partitioning protein